MSKYTTEVRFICETYAGLDHSVGYENVDDVIAKALPKLFNFNFPIFDENYRSVLETKIVKHYYTREICCETLGRWKMFLNTKLNEIMPYYNKLYESADLQYNPLYDADYFREGNKRGEETGQNTHNSTRTDNLKEENNTLRTDDLTTENDREVENKNDHWDYYSDTPQGGLNGIQNNTYLTNVRHTTDDSGGSNENTVQTNTGTQEHTGTRSNTGTQMTNANGTNVVNSTDSYLEHVYGKMPGTSYAKLIEEYRKTLLNIDIMIIEDLQDLFFNLW